MNNEIAAYTIGVIGFERPERHALRRVVAMADGRQPAFKPFDKGRDDGCPHLIMVDADRPSAMRAWHKFRRANAHRASFSPIFVGRNLTDLPCPDPYVLQRPILTTRLFAVLDQAVEEVHGFRPTAATRDQIQRPREINALVVDDSMAARVQMHAVLSPIASRMDFAETGERALELIDTHGYSVIFLDSTLPDWDTYELCERIKKNTLQGKAVLVMVASQSSPADRVMGALAGFDNFLVKPVQSTSFNDLAAELVRPAAAI